MILIILSILYLSGMIITSLLLMFTYFERDLTFGEITFSVVMIVFWLPFFTLAIITADEGIDRDWL